MLCVGKPNLILPLQIVGVLYRLLVLTEAYRIACVTPKRVAFAFLGFGLRRAFGSTRSLAFCVFCCFCARTIFCVFHICTS